MRQMFLPLLFFIILFISNIDAQVNVNLSNLKSFDGEPSLAVNPANPNNLIAGWMRLRADGKVWIATKATFDGGTTWSDIQFLPHEFPDYGSADVSIVFHRTGIAYLSYVDYRNSPDTAGAVFLVYSLDGGKNWSSPKKIIDMKDKPDLPVDRPWIAIDNSGGANDGTVYVTSMTAYWSPTGHHVYMRSTSDRGESWSAIRQVDNGSFSTGTLNKSYGAITVGAEGKVYVAYMSYDTAASPYIRYYVAASYDAGTTFQRYVIGNVLLTQSEIGYTKGYSIAANPKQSNQVVFSWVDQRFGDSDILLKRSTDGGQTWNDPIRINDDSQNSGVGQDLVWSSFSPSGKLAVAWRDRRLNGSGESSPFDIYAAVSYNGGVTFGSNERLSSASSSSPALSCCNSFLGVAINDNFLAVDWGDYRSGDWDIYFQKNNKLVSVDNENDAINFRFSLEQNYPNPFNPTTRIKYSIPVETGYIPSLQLVTLKVYDVLGREVAVLVNEEKPAGTYEIKFDAGGLSSGMYFYKIQSGDYREVKKMMLLK